MLSKNSGYWREMRSFKSYIKFFSFEQVLFYTSKDTCTQTAPIPVKNILEDKTCEDKSRTAVVPGTVTVWMARDHCLSRNLSFSGVIYATSSSWLSSLSLYWILIMGAQSWIKFTGVTIVWDYLLVCYEIVLLIIRLIILYYEIGYLLLWHYFSLHCEIDFLLL
jgi:hypothetical protein